jgi:hypothetical protein
MRATSLSAQQLSCAYPRKTKSIYFIYFKQGCNLISPAALPYPNRNRGLPKSFNLDTLIVKEFDCWSRICYETCFTKTKIISFSLCLVFQLRRKRREDILFNLPVNIVLAMILNTTSILPEAWLFQWTILWKVVTNISLLSINNVYKTLALYQSILWVTKYEQIFWHYFECTIPLVIPLLPESFL